ncbi:hypothetical protein CEXT_263211 [Caerostris extrusa]|uniref:Uncharacterized protein n=1 Tax=Caerostris extrusa TaxID=172846 RepID=A0AAV4REJ7_CAEEX|nr:hypothetical protein CEXT_263211 [Caerostris extrusa]
MSSGLKAFTLSLCDSGGLADVDLQKHVLSRFRFTALLSLLYWNIRLKMHKTTSVPKLHLSIFKRNVIVVSAVAYADVHHHKVPGACIYIAHRGVVAQSSGARITRQEPKEDILQ